MSHLQLTSAEEALFTINIPQSLKTAQPKNSVNARSKNRTWLRLNTTAFRLYGLTFTPEERKVPVCTLGAGERVP